MRNLPHAASRITSVSRRKLYLAILTATQFMAAGEVWAGPEGGQVVGGAGSIKQSGTETVINQQTDRMAIDWQSFDVKVDERVQFIQPNSSSVALNRVLSNKGSEILGRVDANGHVFLVNPNGVVFGKDSHINVGGILASGMSIDPTEFMNGNFTLNSLEGTEGKVINSGIINAATGGSVTLVGKEVKNEGLIVANLGAVNLAAGKEAVVTFDSSGLVGVKVTKAILQNELGVDAAVLNTGEINAQGGRILITASTSQDIFSQAVNHGELSAATSAVVNADGSFTLGGSADVVNTGSLNASSTTGDAGQIVAVGNNVTNSGNISANSQNGKAGHIELNSTDTTQLTQNSIVSAQATASGKGGDIKILGNKVGAFNSASINASGANGGGQILFGGDQTGKNKLVNNANFIYLGENTSAKTDALLNGNGGKLITFAQDTARIYGNLFARGGSEGGNGGFIETSGLKGFELLKTPDISAKNGMGGSWLIDPYNISIKGSGHNATGSGTNSDPFTSASGDSILGLSTLLPALTNNTTVYVQTGGNTGEGDISLDADLGYTFSGTATLKLSAASNIKIKNNISRSGGAGKLNLILEANTAGDTTDATKGNITVDAGKKIETEGGSFTATGKDFTLTASGSNTNSILTKGGDVSLTMTGSVSVGDKNTIATGGGDFTVGEFNANPLLIKRATSFYGTINTSSTTANGGNINIYTTGDASLGSMSFGTSDSNATSTIGSFLVDSSAGNISLTGNYDYTTNHLATTKTMTLNASGAGKTISLTNTVIDNGGNNTNFTKLNLDFNADGNITINDTNTNSSGIWLTGGKAEITSANGSILINNSKAGFAALETEGGNITLEAKNAVTIKGNGVDTGGGDFTVTNSGSFNNNDSANSLLDTSSNNGGGNISITSAGDVTLGGLSFIDLNGGSQTKTGTAKVISGGSVSVNRDIDFADVGTGSFLDISAAKDIGIKANILNSETTPANKFNVLLKANTVSSSTEGDITIDSGKKIETHGGYFFAQGRNFTTTSNATTLISTANDTVATVGGNVDLDMTGVVSIKAPVVTGGGNFTVGTFDSNGPLHRAGSFDGSDTNAIIDTSNNYGGGDIAIATTGNVNLGKVKFNYFYMVADGGVDTAPNPDVTYSGKELKRVGSITIDSNANVTLSKEINFNDTGKRKGDGSDGFTGTLNEDTFLSVKAGGDINVNGKIYDSYGDARDALDITLVAGAAGKITISKDIYTAGGNFIATSSIFDSSLGLIDTNNASDGKDGSGVALNNPTIGNRSNGGDITLNASSLVTLGNLITDANSTVGPRTGNLTVSGITKDADGVSTDNVTVSQATNTKTINVAGATIFNLGNGDIILGSGVSPFTFNSNTFSGVVSVTSARKVKFRNTAATTLGKSNISGDFDLVSDGDITDTATASDSVIVGGTTTIDALNHIITLDNNNDFNIVNFSKNITNLTLNDINALTVGAVTTTGGGATAGAITITAAGPLNISGALTTQKDDSNAGNITLKATGSGATLTTSAALIADGGLNPSGAGRNAGVITLEANSDISVASISAKGSTAKTTGTGGVGGSGGDVFVTSTTGNVSANNINTSGGDAKGTSFAGGSAGAILLSANASTKNILLQNNLSAKGGNKTGSALNGIGKNITLTGDAQINNISGITLDATGSTSGDIKFTKALDSVVANNTKLTLSGNAITFGADVGATNSLGDFVITASGDVGTNGSGRTFNASSFDVTAKNIYANTLNSFGGDVKLTSTGTIDVTKIDTHKDGANGGNLNVVAGALTVNIGQIDTHGGTASAAGFKGGNVTVNSGDITLGAINVAGSDAVVNGNGGSAGTINITATDNANNGTPTITLNGEIAASGGAKAGTGINDGSQSVINLLLVETGTTPNGAVTLNFNNPVEMTVTGGAGTDTLRGLTSATTWVLDGANNRLAPTVNPNLKNIKFLNFENLVGAADVDIFNITAAFAGNIKGGNGDNIFNIGANVTKIEGGTGNDTFNITTTGALTSVLDGGAGTDTLVGANRTNDWVLGTAESLNSTLTFSNIENITGNGGVDTFTFNGTRNPSGTIDAKGGVDIINVATDATIDYTGVFSLFGVSNAEVVHSQSGGILTAKSNAGQNVFWTIASAGNSVTDGTNEVQFTNFTTLTGGAGNDTFDITTAFAGNIKGGNGNNIFNIGASATKIEAGNGNDIFNITTISALTTVLDGGTGTDTLVGANRANDWTLGTTESLNTTVAFSGIENITGNAGVDTFTFNGVRNPAGIIDAKGGVDIINVATDAIIDYTGAFSLFGVNNAEVVHSQSGGVLTAKSNTNQNITWTLANAGNSVTDGTNEVQFTNFAALTGGNGNDTFNVTGTAKVSGVIDGKAGSNIIDLSSTAGGYKVEIASVANTADLTVNNMSKIIGNDNANSVLMTSSGNNNWKIFDFDGALTDADGINDGIVGTTTFINFKNLTGGSGNDTFDFSDVASGSITGKIDGGGGANIIKAKTTDTNTWSMTGNNSGSLSVTANLPATYVKEFVSIQTFNGAGSDTMSFAAVSSNDVKVQIGNLSNGVSGVTTFIGNNQSQSEIVGANAANIWTIDGTNSGKVGSINFSNFKMLTGGTDKDDFTITSTGSFDGLIDGGAGAGKNSFASQSAAGNWILDSATARKGTLNTKSFLNIDEIKGSGSDTLTARDQNNDWTISGVDAGDVHLAGTNNTADKIIFSGVTNLNGLTGVDTFTLEAAGSLSGVIDGGTGANNILINKHTGASWVLDSLAALKGMLNGKTFLNINEIRGSGSDKLTGRNQANDWAITAANEGSVHLAGANTADQITFKGISDLTGGTGKDTFSLETTGSLSGVIDGGDSGNNILINKRAAGVWALDSTTAFKGTLNAKTFLNINEIQGSGNDKLTGRNQDNDWSITGANEGNVHLAGNTNTADKITFKGMSDLSGLAGTDTFTLEVAGSLSGVIDGGDAGDNILINKHAGATWLLDATTAHKGTLDTKTFLNINEIQGSGTDSLMGRSQANDWTITAVNGGNVHLAGDTNTADQITFSGVNNLIGNIEVDKFTFNANFIGDVKGGGKNDEFYINAKVTNVYGEAGDDKFIFSSTGSVTLIDGGTGTANTIVSPADLESSWVLTGANAGTLKSITSVSYANSFQSIQILQGSQLDSLTGRAQANKWTITDVNSGTLKEDIATPLDTIKFTGMKNLIGSTGADYFDFSTSATSEVKGKVDGGDSTSNNIIKARTAANTWTMTDNTTGQLKITNGAVYIPSFLNIQTRIGSGADTIVSDFWDLRNNSQGVTSIQGSNSLTSILIGFDAVNNWEITASNTGTITDTGTQKVVSFEGFNNLAGGNKSDTFKFIEGGSIGGVVKGAADGVVEQADVVNSIKGINAINTWQMTGTNSGTVTSSADTKPYATFSNIQKIQGGSKADLLIGSTNISNTNQTWKLGAENSLVLNQNSNAIKFSDVEEVQGGTGINTLINEVADMSWLLTGANQGTINSIKFSNFGAIQGSGSDSLTGRNQDNSWTIKSADSGELSQSGSTADTINFSKMKNLIGGTGKDTFTLANVSGTTGSISGSISGGVNADDTINTMISLADSNTWSLDGKNKSVNGVKFVNISNVVGSAGVDIFNITSLDTLKVLMDGAGGANDKVDLTTLGVGKDVSIGVGATTSTDLKVINVEIINANNNNKNTLVADNTSTGNEWSITGSNSGTLNKNALNNGTTFNGFANLMGGNTVDNFVFTKDGIISGVIDGNSSVDMNSVLDTVDLTKFETPVSVSIGGTDPGVIHVLNIENIKANANVSNKLIGGSNLAYTWSLTGANSGTVAPATVAPALPLKETVTAFSGFSQLQGGSNVDYFEISDAWIGAVDGGDGKDFVDYSSRTNAFTTLVGGTGNNSVTNVEGFVGNGTNSTIAVADGANTWTLGKIGLDADSRDDGINDGQIFIGNSSQTVYFINFNNIVGGTGDDTFNINAGELTGSIYGGKGNDTFKQTAGIVRGSIYGGEGNDTLIVTLADVPAGKTTFNDNEGTNTINLNGGNANYVAKHTSATIAGGSLSYEANSKTQTIDYLGTFNINDNVVADRLELSGTTNVADVFSLTTNAYSLNKLTTINYKNKDNLKITGEANDKVEINGAVNIPKILTIQNASVSEGENGIINAESLRLDGTAAVGSLDKRIKTNIANLYLSSTLGEAYLQEENSLNLTSFNTDSLFDLTLAGNLTRSAAIASSGVFNVNTGSSLGNIILDTKSDTLDANRLTGGLSLNSLGDIALSNSGVTTLNSVSAQNFSINSTDAINGKGDINVTGLAKFDTTGNVIAKSATNNFNALLISNAADVDLVNKGKLSVQGINASGNIATQSQGITVTGKVAGANVDIKTGSEKAVIGSEMFANNLSINAGNIDINGNLTASSIDLNGQNGLVNLNGVLNTAGKQTVNVSAGQIIQTAKITSGGNTTLTTSGDLNQKADIESGADILIKSGGNFNLDSGKISKGSKIEYLVDGIANFLGSISANTGVHIGGKKEVVQSALLSSADGDIKIDADKLTMTTDAVTTASKGSVAVNTLGDISVSTLNAESGAVTLATSAGKVIDANGDKINVAAKKLQVDSELGIGSLTDALETTVSELSLSNNGLNGGVINIQNNAEVNITRLRSNGDITFTNLKGDVVLDNSQLAPYDKAATDARLAGGPMNANYNVGLLTVNIANGDLLATGVPSLERPDITARAMVINAPLSSIGSKARPLVIYVNKKLEANVLKLYQPYWGFNDKPDVVTGAKPISTSLSTDAGQLVQVETIDEVNPAIFTGVRNYVYDDIAILLPLDQRYGDKDTEE